MYNVFTRHSVLDTMRNELWKPNFVVIL